jgi:hypothetical protein
MAQRLKPILAEQLPTGQYCGVPGRSILDALATICNVIAYHESTRTPLSLLSLDLSQAIDCVSHEYLFKMLPRYGISKWFVERLQAMHDNLLASVQINGSLVGPITIQSGIIQGCSLSMCLYALCLYPLASYLEETLPGLQIERRHLKTTFLAYADDVKLIVTDPSNFPNIRPAIHTNELATGARLNPPKSRALSIAGWTHPATTLTIPFKDRIEILGVAFGPTIALSRSDSWAKLVRAVLVQERTSLARTLCLEQRIQYVNICLLTKIWFTAQILLPTQIHAQQLTAICR